MATAPTSPATPGALSLIADPRLLAPGHAANASSAGIPAPAGGFPEYMQTSLDANPEQAAEIPARGLLTALLLQGSGKAGATQRKLSAKDSPLEGPGPETGKRREADENNDPQAAVAALLPVPAQNPPKIAPAIPEILTGEKGGSGSAENPPVVGAAQSAKTQLAAAAAATIEMAPPVAAFSLAEAPAAPSATLEKSPLELFRQIASQFDGPAAGAQQATTTSDVLDDDGPIPGTVQSQTPSGSDALRLFDGNAMSRATQAPKDASVNPPVLMNGNGSVVSNESELVKALRGMGLVSAPPSARSAAPESLPATASTPGITIKTAAAASESPIVSKEQTPAALFARNGDELAPSATLTTVDGALDARTATRPGPLANAGGSPDLPITVTLLDSRGSAHGAPDVRVSAVSPNPLANVDGAPDLPVPVATHSPVASVHGLPDVRISAVPPSPLTSVGSSPDLPVPIATHSPVANVYDLPDAVTGVMNVAAPEVSRSTPAYTARPDTAFTATLSQVPAADAAQTLRAPALEEPAKAQVSAAETMVDSRSAARNGRLEARREPAPEAAHAVADNGRVQLTTGSPAWGDKIPLPAATRLAASDKPPAPATASQIPEPPAAPTAGSRMERPRELSVVLPGTAANGGARENVEVRVVDRGGELHVAVHTRDQDLAQSLRKDLGTLVNNLERAGYRTETWQPTEARSSGTTQLSNSDSGAGREGSRNSQGGHPGSSGDQPGNQRQGREPQPEWAEEMDRQRDFVRRFFHERER